MMYYSKSTGGFYSIEVNGNAIPSDAIEIDDEQHQILLAGQSVGKIIQADAKGIPFLVDAPVSSPQPLTVTPYQFKAALVQQGLYAQALTAVNNGDVLTQLAWAEAQTFVENDSHIVAIATALGKTTADIHTLFQLAGTLAP